MAFPIFRHHDAPQRRMAKKANAKKIENFALKEIGGRPDRRDGFDARVIALELHFQPHTLLALHREQMVGNLKTRLAWKKIGTGEIGKEIHKSLGLELFASLPEKFAPDINGE